MNELETLKQVVKNLNEAVKELQAEVKALKEYKQGRIELVYGDTTEFLSVDFIALVEKTGEDDFPYGVLLKTGHYKKISQRLYDQIYAVLHKPSEEKETV